MRVPKKYRGLISEALMIAAQGWQRCADDAGGCQPSNESYERSRG